MVYVAAVFPVSTYDVRACLYGPFVLCVLVRFAVCVVKFKDPVHVFSSYVFICIYENRQRSFHPYQKWLCTHSSSCHCSSITVFLILMVGFSNAVAVIVVAMNSITCIAPAFLFVCIWISGRLSSTSHRPTACQPRE